MNVNRLQRKKPSEMMGEYVAGKNRVNVIPRVNQPVRQQQPVTSGMTRLAETAYNRQQAQHQGARSRAQSIVQSRQVSTPQTSTPQIGGTVLTQEQVLANNINDIIKQMNEIMSQPGNLMSPSASPYYNIYMEQYRKNAEAAEANAFARSVASTGGYGSSYATMAGQQAYRDTMEGFTELTPSLVQTKGQAMSDLMAQYQLAKGLKDQLDVEETAAGVNSYTRSDGTTVEVNDAKVQGAYDYIASTLQGGGSIEQVENTIREGLKNQRTADGEAYTEDEINAAIDRYKGVENAALADVHKNNYESLKKDLEVPSQINLTEYGYTAEEVEKMGEDEYNSKAKLALLEKAGQLVRNGELTMTAYYKILHDDIKNEFSSKEYQESDTKERDALDIALIVQDFYKNGYMSEDVYKNLMYRQIVPQIKNTRFWDALDKQDIEMGEDKKYSWISNPFNALENYNNVGSYGSPEIAKIAKGLSKEHRILLLDLVREERKKTTK